METLLRVPATALALTLLVLGPICPPAAAQTVQQRQFYLVDAVVVKPSLIEQYEAAVQDVVALWNENEFPFACRAYKTDDHHYYFTYPLEDYSALDQLRSATSAFRAAVGLERWGAIRERYIQGNEYSHVFLVRYRPDLSNPPQGIANQELRFRFLEFYYPVPGKEHDFEQVLSKLLSLLRKVDVSFPYDVFVGDIGTERPLYLMVHGAKDRADYYSKRVRRGQLLGEAGETLDETMWTLVRRFEAKAAVFRPELSYVPQSSVGSTGNACGGVNQGTCSSLDRKR